MIPIIGYDRVVGQWVAERAHSNFRQAGYTALGVYHRGNIVAGAAFYDCNGPNIFVDLAIENPFATRLLFTLAGRYCFKQLGVKRLTFVAESSNLQALKLHERLGAVREGCLVGAGRNGDNIFISRLTPDLCPLWRKLNGIERWQRSSSPELCTTDSASGTVKPQPV